MTRLCLFVNVVLALTIPTLAVAQEMPAEYAAFMKSIERSGDFKDGVLKVNIPRNDLQVTINGRSVPTPFGFGGWLALTPGEGGTQVMMGDLVLTEAEVRSQKSSGTKGSRRVRSTRSRSAGPI